MVSWFDQSTVSSSRPAVTTTSRADAVKAGRRFVAASQPAFARPRLDGAEHHVILANRRSPSPTRPALMVATDVAKSSNRRLMRDLLRSQPPTRAGNLPRRELDMFFEAHQLPIARTVGEGETGLAGKADHDVVGAQRIAKQAFGAEGCRAAFQIFEQCRTDALALQPVVDRQAELET